MKARVKCVALSRMVYGDDDWCYARSLLMLAKAYHQHGGENNLYLYHTLVYSTLVFYKLKKLMAVLDVDNVARGNVARGKGRQIKLPKM